MTPDEPGWAAALDVLKHAAVHEATPARTEAIRQRCHRALARRSARSDRPRGRTAGRRAVLEPALVAGVCLIYLGEVIRRALLLYGL
jgi:hypothetical protein